MGAQGALRTQLFQKLLDGLPEQVALVSQDGTILAANRRWLRRQARLKIDRLSAGDNIINYSAQLGAAGDKAALEFAQKLREVCAGNRTECSHLYVGVGPYAGQSVKISVSRFSSFGEQLILVDARDVNDVLDLRRQRRRLGSRLLRAQEDERRRIARELHDSASQLLVGVQLNLMQLKRDIAGPDTDRLLADCATTVDRIQNEFRTFAFIHHPPPLGTEGIGTAIGKLMGGFAKRTGLQVEMFIDEIRETSHGIEATLYRVAEEALANIYRHAKATSVKLWLIGADTCVHLVISDDGIGFDGVVRNGRLRWALGSWA